MTTNSDLAQFDDDALAAAVAASNSVDEVRALTEIRLAGLRAQLRSAVDAFNKDAAVFVDLTKLLKAAIAKTGGTGTLNGLLGALQRIRGSLRGDSANPPPPPPTPSVIRVLPQGDVTPNRSDDTEAAADTKTSVSPTGSAVLTGTVRSWRVAKSLDQLLAQVNALAPGRNKDSDGAIGDARHQQSDSDHNPWVKDGTTGVVTARDFTDDAAKGCSAEAIFQSLIASKDARLKYLIWNKQIVSSQVSPWKVRVYGGANPHQSHIHVSVLPDQARYDDASNWDLSQVQVAGVVNTFGVATADDVRLAWGKKVTGAFKKKVISISAQIGCDPNDLMAAMAFETGRTFDPAEVNGASGATGLIQFMPATARSLGTTTALLAAMTAVDQLDYVSKYFSPYRGRLRDLSDLYMAILWPAAVGKPASFELFRTPSIAYRQNSGLDENDDGAVTKAEAAARVQKHLVEGMRDDLLG
jgi:hypothetical protein